MFAHYLVLVKYTKAHDNMPYDNVIFKAKPYSHYQDNTRVT